MYVKGQDDPVDTITLEGHDTTIKGVLCIEIGGLNSTEPMIVAAELGLPVVDMDFMGRAFPELQVCKYYSFMLFRDTHTRYYFRVVLLLWFHNAMLPRATYCGYDFRGKTFLMQKMVYVSHESVLWIWKSRGLPSLSEVWPSQWETELLCNDISYCLGASPESSLQLCGPMLVMINFQHSVILIHSASLLPLFHAMIR